MTKYSKRKRAKRPAGVAASRSTDAMKPSRLDAQVQLLGEMERVSVNVGAELDTNRMRTAWCVGDWEALANMSASDIEHHSERHLIALLVAGAQQQLGRHDEARRNVRLALGWGCPPRAVAQILVAGVHNTLGRAAALARNKEGSQRHFDNAVVPGASESDLPLVSQVRSLRELSRLGLLPQAADLLRTAVRELQNGGSRPGQVNARVKALESELDLLTEELSLAQQRRMILNPDREQDATAAAIGSQQWLADLKQRSVSQLGQDLWVLEKSGYKREGFFVEFGAVDGVLLSNSYLLETEFGWSGLCAEPNPKMYAQLRRNRRCTVSDACISGTSGKEVDFIFAGAFGGIAEHSSADLHAERRAVYAAAGQVGRVSTVSLDDFLRKYNAPHDIDYLSIDTEGSELEILASFPFEKWNIRLITVEHNYTAQRQSIFELLHRHGYRRAERDWEDWYSKSDA